MKDAIGLDLYNQATTGGVSMTVTSKRSDPHHVPCVIVYDSRGQDARYRPLGEVCETISAKYGTGGGNAPIVVKYERS